MRKTSCSMSACTVSYTHLMNGNVVLVKPEGGVSTAAAYRAFDEHPTAISEDVYKRQLLEHYTFDRAGAKRNSYMP